MEYNEEQLAILADGCLAIFHVIASSDGKISRAEEEIFLANHLRSLSMANIIDNPKEQAVMEFILHDYIDQTRIAKACENGIEESLKAVRHASAMVRHKEHPEAFSRYQNAMLMPNSKKRHST